MQKEAEGPYWATDWDGRVIGLVAGHVGAFGVLKVS